MGLLVHDRPVFYVLGPVSGLQRFLHLLDDFLLWEAAQVGDFIARVHPYIDVHVEPTFQLMSLVMPSEHMPMSLFEAAPVDRVTYPRVLVNATSVVEVHFLLNWITDWDEFASGDGIKRHLVNNGMTERDWNHGCFEFEADARVQASRVRVVNILRYAFHGLAVMALLETGPVPNTLAAGFLHELRHLRNLHWADE